MWHREDAALTSVPQKSPTHSTAQGSTAAELRGWCCAAAGTHGVKRWCSGSKAGRETTEVRMFSFHSRSSLMQDQQWKWSGCSGVRQGEHPDFSHCHCRHWMFQQQHKAAPRSFLQQNRKNPQKRLNLQDLEVSATESSGTNFWVSLPWL